MFVTLVSAIGAIIALALLVLMSLSSVLPEVVDRFATARRSTSDRAQQSQVSPRTSPYPSSGGSSATARRTGVAAVRGTGSRAVFQAGSAGPLPW
ncbi:hypothetical protein A8926_0870 [Saccharopolyspora spinosa]|uniref:Uncharacterized protein n=1 Tax=Saccharopolyspora spinosa TaxID=60894 RepID=A0A2N3XRP7_SACSN|nr:hypothetical protein A8926_0870 [Saccharopolyspora spinosa]